MQMVWLIFLMFTKGNTFSVILGKEGELNFRYNRKIVDNQNGAYSCYNYFYFCTDYDLLIMFF